MRVVALRLHHPSITKQDTGQLMEHFPAIWQLSNDIAKHIADDITIQLHTTYKSIWVSHLLGHAVVIFVIASKSTDFYGKLLTTRFS